MNSFDMARVKSTDFLEHAVQSIQTSRWQPQSLAR